MNSPHARENRARSALSPVTTHLLVTYRCNVRCAHCYLDGVHDSELPTEAWVELMPRLRSLGAFFLTFSGGEFFVRQDWEALLRAARRQRFFVRIITNGTLIDDSVIRKLLKLRVNEVDVSLYSLSQTTHDTITGVEGSFERTMRAVDLILGAQIPLRTKTPIMRSNARDFPDIVRWAQERGIQPNYDLGITPKWRADRQGAEPSSEAQAARLVRRLAPHLPNELRSIPKRDEESFLCGVARSLLLLTPSGTVHPCVDWPEDCGNFTKTPIETIWRESPVLERIRNTRFNDYQDCQQCELIQHCLRCPGLAYLETGSYLGCSSQLRARAEFLRDLYKQG